MQRLTSNSHNAVYEKHRQILNKPGNPTFAWAPIENSALLDRGDKSGSMPNSNNFFLCWESRCIVAPSTIPDAGCGLFVQPHKNTISINTHLCIYAERSTMLEEVTAGDSSRMYLIHSAKKPSYFNAEIEITLAALLTSLESCKHFARLKKCPQKTSRESQR